MNEETKSTEAAEATSTTEETHVDATISDGNGQEAAAVSPEEGTNAEVAPFDVESHERRMQDMSTRIEGFEDMRRGMQSENSKLSNTVASQAKQLTSLQEQLSVASDAELTDDLNWADKMSSGKSGVKVIDDRARVIASSLIKSEMDKRFGALREEQQQSSLNAEEQVAQNQVADVASKHNLTKEQYNDLHLLNPGLKTVSPREYVRLATNLIKQMYSAQLAHGAPTRNAEASRQAAEKRITRGGPSVSASVNASATAEAPSQAWISYMKEGEDEDIPVHSR